MTATYTIAGKKRALIFEKVGPGVEFGIEDDHLTIRGYYGSDDVDAMLSYVGFEAEAMRNRGKSMVEDSDRIAAVMEEIGKRTGRNGNGNVPRVAYDIRQEFGLSRIDELDRRAWELAGKVACQNCGKQRREHDPNELTCIVMGAPGFEKSGVYKEID